MLVACTWPCDPVVAPEVEVVASTLIADTARRIIALFISPLSHHFEREINRYR